MYFKTEKEYKKRKKQDNDKGNKTCTVNFLHDRSVGCDSRRNRLRLGKKDEVGESECGPRKNRIWLVRKYNGGRACEISMLMLLKY